MVAAEPARGSSCRTRSLTSPGWPSGWSTRAVPASISDTAKRALEQSLRQALARKHRSIGVEHLLLGLLADERGTAAFVLQRVGASPQAVRDRLVGELKRAA